MTSINSLNTCFISLSSIISLDPEDQDFEQLERVFKLCLKQHDYSYEMSDDSFVYNRGRQEQSIIERAANEHSELMALYKAYITMREGKIA